MKRRRSSALVLLLVLSWAADSLCCESPGNKCDFVCDCSDCSDEQNCGYAQRAFVCDFEDAGLCGWEDQSVHAAEYSWQRQQTGGHSLPDSGPSSDYTTGTAAGWFMGVSAVTAESSRTAVLVSPEMRQSAPTCRLRLRYFLWDSGHTDLGSTPLWASVLRQDSREAFVWRPEATSVRGWREDTVFLGRVPTAFRIRLNSARSAGQRGDVAVDQLEFLDCALPRPQQCPPTMLPCKNEGCVTQRQRCDGTDDCGDGTDEENCESEGYQLCDFEDATSCVWDLRSLSSLLWVRTSQVNISTSDPLKGPGRDHSSNSAAGHFLYVTVPDGGLTNDWASFQSRLLDPTNSSHPCKMVMYTHQFGPRSGGLTVLIADKNIYPVWERGGALGDVWVKAEVEIVTSSPFQIVLMAAIRNFPYGGIAVDSIMLSPGCRLSSENYTLANFPKSPKDPCTEPDNMCDFKRDCPEAEDEAKCGDFSYTDGSSGWTDSSIGSQGWKLHENTTSKEQYLYVVEAPGQQLTEAQTRTPLLGPSGPVCSLSFDFALAGEPDHIGELSVRVIDGVLGVQPQLWEFSGRTGAAAEEEEEEEGAWRSVNLTVGARKHRFQLAFEAHAQDPSSRIKVRNVRFVDCFSEYLPAAPTGLSCNFEDGLCGWYQDKSDNFDWSVVSGSDHTIGVGKSLTVDMWSPSLRGTVGRLLSFPQSPSPSDHCLSFFYKLYGPNTGTLNVKLTDGTGYEIILWTRSGAHGNMWHEGHCPVPNQLTSFQLMFEAVRSGFDGQVAVDDVEFVERSCSAPRMCSFEGQRCGYTSSGTTLWLHRSGSGITRPGPKTDHTLETQLGFYMMANTGVDVLPSGSSTVLTSPVRQGTTKTECVHFWYHMGGENPGSLTVYMKPTQGDRVKIFSEALDQGDVWRRGNGNITGNLVDWQLEFEVVGAGGKDTHVAVDDVFFSAHACLDRGSRCDLERGMCTWSNTQNAELDQLDWELTSWQTERHYSVPAEDHSLGTEKGHFLFLPSTNRTSVNSSALLLSPHLPPTRGTCVKFWAHIPSSSGGMLKVCRLSKDLHPLMEVREVTGLWQRFQVDVMSAEEYQIAFQGLKGAWGLVALDDIEYTVGINCANQVTDPQTSAKRVNAGGIAASVIVLLLLIGTLVALLVYYLRTRQTTGQRTETPPPSGDVGFSNTAYESEPPDHIVVPPAQNHPMAAGFNHISFSDVREVEVE